jgi:hypothetical protein
MEKHSDVENCPEITTDKTKTSCESLFGFRLNCWLRVFALILAKNPKNMDRHNLHSLHY